MMKRDELATYLSTNEWAMHVAKLAEILFVIAVREEGRDFTEAEIAARFGDGVPRPASTRGAVAVIPIRGVIAHRAGAFDDRYGGTSCERIGAMIDQVAADASVGTIVYDFDSPGGTVPGIQELAAKMFALRGQVKQIAQINSLAASAAYWLASQCDERICMPSGAAGSIGVYTAHQDLSPALEREGIPITLISAGKYKVEGNPFGPLSPEAKAVKQASVDAAYAQFTADVARGLGVSPKDVRNGYGEGRVLSAKDAKAAGLIDRIATMDETLGRLVGRQAATGGMRAEQVRDTSPEGRQRRTLLDAFMASARGLPPDKIAELIQAELAAAADADSTEAKAVWGGKKDADPEPDAAADARARRRRFLE